MGIIVPSGTDKQDEIFDVLADTIHTAMPWEGETYQAVAEHIAAAIISARCGEDCHEAGRDECIRCDSLIWAIMCDSCRGYAVQDGA